MIVVDARGYSCPEPVILAKQAINAGKFPIQVLVDTVTSRENVRRMAEFSGCVVEVSQQGDEFSLILRKK
jgi:TusA-related sulfurtransferase